MVLQRSTSGGDKVDLEKSSATANVQDAATVSRVDPPGSVSDSDNKRILRKIGAPGHLPCVMRKGAATDRPSTCLPLWCPADCNIMPLLCFVYLIQFLDKTSLSYASIMGLREDNDLSLSEYSWLSSIF